MIPLAVTDSAFAVATTNQYDEQGRTTQVANAQGIINYAYNDLGQQVRTWTSTDLTGTDAVTDTRYSYDSLGRLSTVAVYERFNAYAPGAGSEPNTAEELTTYHYDAVGNLDYLVTDAISGTAITTDYVYDSLNRLDALTHFVDADGDGSYDELTEQAMAQFDYTLDAAGNRTAAAETVDGHEYQWSWSYDALNRLTGETLETPTPGDEALAYADTFTYDLVGNRAQTTHDAGGEGGIDQSTTYAYDANDRLLTEVTDHTSDNSQDRYTQYSYAHTTQTGKTVYEGLSDQGVLQSTTAYQYDAMGRMVETTETTYTNGVDPQTKTTQYAYNAQGLRVTETVTDAGGTVTTKSYLFDPTGGHTGYAQVLEEYLNGQLAYAYTLGHDVIAVAKAANITDALGNTAATVHHLLTDGHGSTRLLANLANALAGQLPGVIQQFAYTAYGIHLTAAHLADATTALTRLLYSGEWTNANGQQYLRARWYDPTTGRFNRLDPFAGNQNDPQSLHKYLYAHGNPVMGWDPSGLRWSIPQILGTITVGTIITSIALPAIGAAYLSVRGDISPWRVGELLFRWPDAAVTWTAAAAGVLAGSGVSVAVQAGLLKLVGREVLKKITPGVGLAFALVGLYESIKLTYRMVARDLPAKDAEQYIATMMAGNLISALLGAKIRKMSKYGSANDAAYWKMTPEDQALYNKGQGLLPSSIFNKLSNLTPVNRGRELERQFSGSKLLLKHFEGFAEMLANTVNPWSSGGITVPGWLGTGLTPAGRFVFVENGVSAVAGTTTALNLAAQYFDELID